MGNSIFLITFYAKSTLLLTHAYSFSYRGILYMKWLHCAVSFYSADLDHEFTNINSWNSFNENMAKRLWNEMLIPHLSALIWDVQRQPNRYLKLGFCFILYCTTVNTNEPFTIHLSSHSGTVSEENFGHSIFKQYELWSFLSIFSSRLTKFLLFYAS